MKMLPSEILDYLHLFTIATHSPAYLRLTGDGRLQEAGGELQAYGLEALRLGESAAAQIDFLEGLLPLEGEPVVWNAVEVAPGRFADIHVFTGPETNWVLLMDATEEVSQRAQTEDALRRSEEQSRQSGKMEAIGRMAGGLAHDFNNLLTIILGYSDIVLRELPEKDLLRPPLEEIRKAADTSASLISKLLALSRKQVVKSRVVSLNFIVLQFEEMLRRLIGEDIRLALNLDSGLPQVRVDPGQIEQVLINLLANCRDAMPDGGAITVETRLLESLDEPAPKVASAGWVLLQVADTGYGMDEQTVSHIFEPYFTTKEPGKGTGLGLATVYGIVKQWRGEIGVESHPGRGTTVRILFPRAEQEADRIQRPAAVGPSAHCPVGILLVEDDKAVRALIAGVLRDGGYTVMEAAAAEEALRLARSFAQTIRLLVSDVVMPGMSGAQLASELRSLQPGIGVLLLSGYARDHRPLPFGEADFLQKPFTIDTLLLKVNEILDRSQSVKIY